MSKYEPLWSILGFPIDHSFFKVDNGNIKMSIIGGAYQFGVLPVK